MQLPDCRIAGKMAIWQWRFEDRMSKRPSLAESMRAAVVAPDPEPTPPPTKEPPTIVLPAGAAGVAPKAVPARRPAAGEERPPGYYAATRAGKKKATAPLDKMAHRQLKSLALEREGGTVEKLLIEAINDLFRKYGKSPIA
jgi:hypothetical protein